MEDEILKTLATWFLYFAVYSVAGYILEVSHSADRNKTFSNRGYLFGPYCPIYGVGAVIMLLVTKEVSMNPFMTFLMAMMACTVLEYITSFIMEKLFNMRWWDYTYIPYNLNGRVCLRNAILFGIGGMVIIYITQPAVSGIIAGLPDAALYAMAGVMFVVMLVDTIMSTVATYHVKGFIKEVASDSTVKIKKLAKDYYHERRERVRKIRRSFK